MKYWYNDKIPSHPHAVLFKVANQENLLKLSKAATPRDEVVEWLNENIGVNQWEQAPLIGMINFTHKESALAFILRWS